MTDKELTDAITNLRGVLANVRQISDAVDLLLAAIQDRKFAPAAAVKASGLIDANLVVLRGFVSSAMALADKAGVDCGATSDQVAAEAGELEGIPSDPTIC